MTEIQVSALIAIILMICFVYWLGYRNGFKEGRDEGHSVGYSEGYDIGGSHGYADGVAVQRSDRTEELHNLQLTLEQAHVHRKQLYARYERALAASKLGETARATLLDIAEKLRIAAETFSAFRTGKKLERETRVLHDQALAMAALLEPAKQEDAA
ncbi:hypothetical protein [Pseudomonas sp. B11(2017)]|uniref:hypothetical protein n=1 Tax=Pseudomonas sp. B11(2017) TaxID=1981748 RepID=UPI000A1F3E5D|nr:hypothetical protein [Pseudomonas sp. B11(2017)]